MYVYGTMVYLQGTHHQHTPPRLEGIHKYVYFCVTLWPVSKPSTDHPRTPALSKPKPKPHKPWTYSHPLGLRIYPVPIFKSNCETLFRLKRHTYIYVCVCVAPWPTSELDTDHPHTPWSPTHPFRLKVYRVPISKSNSFIQRGIHIYIHIYVALWPISEPGMDDTHTHLLGFRVYPVSMSNSNSFVSLLSKEVTTSCACTHAHMHTCTHAHMHSIRHNTVPHT